MKYNLVVILGPTASGKTRLAARLARDIGGEIISADSRQVYRGMDIGTGKDLSEYVVDGMPVPCHLIDVADPAHLFSVFEFQLRFYECFRDVSSRGKWPLLVGGTGLYIESVLRGYRMLPVPENVLLREELAGKSMDDLAAALLQLNPALHNTTDLTGRERLVRAIEIAEHGARHGEEAAIDRPGIAALVIGIRWDRRVLRQRISNRLRKRLEEGLVEEVRGLHDDGVSWERLEEMGLEYRYVGRFLRGELAFGEMFKTLETRIHQFAKRQETWFRGMERRGVPVAWVDGADVEALRALVRRELGRR